MPDDLNVVTDFAFDSTDQALITAAAGVGSRVTFARDVTALRLALPRATVLCTFRPPKDVLQIAPDLRWLQFPGAGVDSLTEQGFDLATLPFAVTTASSANAVATAEFVMGAMLVIARKWDEMVRLQAFSEWASGQAWGALRGFELGSKTLGIIGLGTIGRRVARLAHAFDMRVLGLRRTAKADATDPDCDRLYAPEQVQELLSASDIVLISVPLTRATTGLIGEQALRAMRPNAYLINVARGAVIDEPALIRALRERWIAGAALDVVADEPLSRTSPLWTTPGVIITPHISGMTTGYARRLATLFAENLRHWRAGEPLLHRVDGTQGY